MPLLPSLSHRRRSTAIAAVLGVSVVTGGAVLFIPGPAAQATGLANAGVVGLEKGAQAGAVAAEDAQNDAADPSASASASDSASSSATAAVPEGRATLTVSAEQKVPGTPKLTWPTQGQARIDLDGASLLSNGTLGTYGPVNTAQPIASVTKTMTAFLILRDHPLSPGEQGPTITLTAADVSAYQYDVSENMSSVPVKAGEQLTENQALQALMLASADNIADVLAHWDTASTTDTKFVAKMNAAAASLGMTHTHYTDVSGYDPGSTSTAPDQIVLGRSAMLSSYFSGLVAQTSATIPVAGTITNYNSLLGYEGVDGIKTGSTGQAGGCLLFDATFTVNGRRLHAVGAVLGQDAPTGQELGVGLAAAKALINSTEAQVGSITVLSASDAVATIPMSDGTIKTLRPMRDLVITAWPGEAVNFRIGGFPTQPVLQVYASDNTPLGTVPLH